MNMARMGYSRLLAVPPPVRVIMMESSLVSRTSKFRRRAWDEMSLIPNIHYRQFQRGIWTQCRRLQQQQQNATRFKLGNTKLFSYVRSLKWNPIPVSVGIGFLVFLQYRKHLRKIAEESSVENQRNSIVKDWEITCYRMLPWKTVSRFWGWMNNVNLPLWARGPFLNWYVRRFGCAVEEAEVSDLATYSNLGEFFRRGLKSGVRPIDELSPLISPCDGRILHFGKVDCGRIEQVKGVSYSLPAFLGPKTWGQKVPSEDAARMLFGDDQKGRIFSFPKRTSSRNIDSESYCSQILKQSTGTNLFYCVIYLAPGDYHRFHSPVEWNVQFRRHIGGELLSVNPTVAGWIAGLFSLNERANYIGEWKHGFFAMTAVGATNVGSIRVYRDEDLQTNSRKVKKNAYVDKCFPSQLRYKKGEDFGEFNLGSTIVLLFEAPSQFDFNLLEAHRRVKMGEPLLLVQD